MSIHSLSSIFISLGHYKLDHLIFNIQHVSQITTNFDFQSTGTSHFQSFLLCLGGISDLIIVSVVVHVHQDLHLLVRDVLLVQEGAVLAPALVDAVVDALTADTLTAAVMEPTVACGAHTGAGGFTLVPGHALRHVGHAAVHRHLPGVHQGGLVQAVGVHGDDLLVDGEEGGHVDVDREGDDGPPALGVLLVGEGLEESWNVVLQVLTIIFS